MSASWGNNYRVSIYGESHGAGVGIMIDGLPAGIDFPEEYINRELYRRKPGRGKFTTSRKEDDNFRIISGIFNGKTTGTPINIFVENKNMRSRDYSKIKDNMRPGHGDYAGYEKYFGYNDYRGGGHFSGRLTAGIVIAGAFARSILENMDIYIGAHIKSIRGIKDESFNPLNIKREDIERLKDPKEQFPLLNEEIRRKMQTEIIKAKENRDSVGGMVEVGIIGLKPGVGNPYFNSLESSISSMIFSVPGIKGIEFGAGFDFSHMYGSEGNDQLYIENGEINHSSNNNGGITGGISNGMPLIFRVGIKPTPSIGKTQRTVNTEEMKNTEINIEGRHDPCIVPRVVPVLENATAIVLLDSILERIKENEGFRVFKKRN